MPPASKVSPKGLQGRLTAKVGPLPVWGWAAAILGAYFLYTKFGKSASSGSTAPVSNAPTVGGADTSNGSGAVGSGGGSSGDSSGTNADLIAQAMGALSGTVDSLTAALIATSPQQASTAPGDTTPSSPTGAYQTPPPQPVGTPSGIVAPTPSQQPPQMTLVTSENRPTQPGNPKSVNAAEFATKTYAATQPGQTRTAGF